MKQLISLIAILFSFYILTDCYSFKNVSLSPEIETFSVEKFDLLARNAPPTLDRDFTEALKNKIRTESRLKLVNDASDLHYSGSITSYNVRSMAPMEGETTSFNRLEIRVKVNFSNRVENDKNWDQAFSFFADYPSDQVLTDVQDQLIAIIFEQVTEDIFNRSFSDWQKL